MNECKPLPTTSTVVNRALGVSNSDSVAPDCRGLHSFPFPLNLSLLCPSPLNLSLICPQYDPD